MKCHRYRDSNGMALPMVLWTIALLAGMAVLLAGVIQGWISEETRSGNQFKARQQALSGIAVAMNPAVLPGDPLLSARSSDGKEGYDVSIGDEAGLINPNTLLSATPDRRDVLRNLFGAWGLAPIDSETAADGLYDWQSGSPFRSLHGAKLPEYQAAGKEGLPPGAPFSSPDEMELVIGFDPVRRARTDWRSHFTTFHGGKLNILRAPKPILVDLIGLTPSQAGAWITLRNGKDGIMGTADDIRPGSIAEAAGLIGANAAQRAQLLDLCDVTGSVRRIESRGFFNGAKHHITVITGPGATGNDQSGVTVLGWKEQ